MEDEVYIYEGNEYSRKELEDEYGDRIDEAIEKFGSPIYVRHEVVHNKIVVEDLKSKGVIFVDELDEVPDGERVIFSAHGVAKSVEDEAEKRNLNYFDATCPLVTKVHNEVIRHNRANRDVVLIGHAGHPEVEGTMGRHINKELSNIYLVQDESEALKINVSQPDNLALVTQTTLSVDDTKSIIGILKERFPNIKVPKKDDICYATQNRQDAVKQLALESDVVLVVGSVTSSNSNRLKELAERCGCQAFLIDGAEDIQEDWLRCAETIGITAGASAPEVLVRGVVDRLVDLGAQPPLELDGVTENISFSLPRELRV